MTYAPGYEYIDSLTGRRVTVQSSYTTGGVCSEPSPATRKAQLPEDLKAKYAGATFPAAYEKLVPELIERIVRAEAVVGQVDDVLTVNWIKVQNNDYRKALNDLVTLNIHDYDNPAVSEIAKERLERIENAEATIAELVEALQSIYQQVTNGRLGYFGDHTGYCPQFSSDETQRWKASIARATGKES